MLVTTSWRGDEGASWVGVVTLEDVLERIVGLFEDEFDRLPALENSWPRSEHPFHLWSFLLLRPESKSVAPRPRT